MTTRKNSKFDIEWLPQRTQVYHGPRKRMKEILCKYSRSKSMMFTQNQVIDYIQSNFQEHLHVIDKIKFYRVFDKGLDTFLHFFLVWCNYSINTRYELYERSEEITSRTGWYPVITGRRSYHHHRHLLDFIDNGLRRAMNKTDIERLSGIGNLLDIIRFSKGTGTSILIKTTHYDILLDAGMNSDDLKYEMLRHGMRKLLFISHSHKDHTGGWNSFVNDKNCVILINPITLELVFNTISQTIEISEYLPENFFYRVAPMWYRTKYNFSDSSSIETIPTYHYPGSMGYLFTFRDGKTLFYSGDINISSSYHINHLNSSANSPYSFDLNRKFINYGILDGAFVGRKIGSLANNILELSQVVTKSISVRRNHLILAPPSDYGFFLFLHLYDALISKTSMFAETVIFLDPQIIRQLEIIEWRMKRKHRGTLDDALIKFLEKRRTLAESVLVYNFSSNIEENLKQLNNRNLNAVFILDDHMIDDQNYLSRSNFDLLKAQGLDISRLGKAATKTTDIELFAKYKINDYDNHIWLLHSNEDSLANYLLYGKQAYGKIYIFHNFKNRIKKFIKHLEQSGFSGEISFL